MYLTMIKKYYIEQELIDRHTGDVLPKGFYLEVGKNIACIVVREGNNDESYLYREVIPLSLTKSFQTTYKDGEYVTIIDGEE